MRVAVAGGHGKIGRLLIRDLVARGDEVVSLDRNPAYADEIRGWGAEPVACDLETASEEEVAGALGEVDAVVFAAGAGPGSGPDRKWAMDRDGAVKLMAAARANDVRRYVLVSSIGADPGAEGDDTFAVYLRAKGEADAALAASGLDFTIIRPTSLTDEPAAGTVTAAEHVERQEVSREDVASAIDEVLRAPSAIGLTFELTSGATPVADAIAAL